MNRLILPHDFRKGGARRQYPPRGCRLNFSPGMEREGRGRVVPAAAHPPYPPNCAVSFEDCATPHSPLFLRVDVLEFLEPAEAVGFDPAKTISALKKVS